MSKLNSVEALDALREQIQKEQATRTATETNIIVGMGTCGIAAGAQETRDAIVEALKAHDIDARVTSVGCIGICSEEPLVDIVQAGQPRITYCNVQPDMVPRLIEEHLVKGQVVREWVLGRVPLEGIRDS